MAYSDDDQNRLRSAYGRTKAILNLTPKVVIATAQINQSAYTYPVAQLQIDTLDVVQTPKPGHMVMIGTTPGAYDVTCGVLRKPIDGAVMYIDAKSQGDSGVPQNIRTPLGNNQYVTIIKFRPAWGLLSSIRAGIFYKQWDIPYRGQGSNPDPVCVMGEWRQAFAPADGTVTLPFSSTGSFGWGSKNIISLVTWNLDGGSFHAGSTLHNPSILADFAPGFYEIECTVRDAIGKNRVGYRYLWVNVDDPTSEFAPFSYRYPVQVTEDNQVVAGRNMTYSFGGNLQDIDELYPGQGVLMSEKPRFNRQPESLDTPDFVGTYVGYRTEVKKTTSYKRRLTEFPTLNPVLMGSFIPAATQEMNEVPNPSNWTEVNSKLSNPAGAVWYIAAHHAPYLIDGHDFVPSAASKTARRQTFQFKSTDIAGQIKTVSDMSLSGIGNRSNGRLRIVRNPMYLSNDERNDMPVKWIFIPDDIAGELQYSVSYRLTTRKVNGYAFSFDGTASTPYQSLAPGYADAQATGTTSMTAFIAPPGTGQAYTNEVTGHQLAYDDVQPFNFAVNGNIDIAEPIDMDVWYQRAIPGKYDSEALSLSGRMMNTRISRSWDFENGVNKKIQAEFRPESYGVPGVTVPVNRGGANTWWLSDWNPGVFDVFTPDMPDLGLTLPVMLASNADGLLARTFTFGQPNVAWQRLNGHGMIGRVVSFAMDFNSPYFSNPASGIRYMVLTWDNSVLRLYTYQNARNTNIVFTEFAGSGLAVGTGFKGKAKVLVSPDTPGLVTVVWRNQTGVMFSRSTTASPTLTAPAHVGVTISDTFHDSDDIGADISGDSQFVIAPDGTTTLDDKPAYKLYLADGTGAFAQVSGAPDGDSSALVGFVKADTPLEAFVSYVKADPPDPPPTLGIVTFDPGGQSGYIIFGAGTIGLGHPGDCAWNTFNADGSGGNVGITVDCNYLAGQYDVEDIVFDVNNDVDGSVSDMTEVYEVTAYTGDKVVGHGFAKIRQTYGDGWAQFGITANELDLKESPDTIRVESGYSFSDSSPFTIVYTYLDNIAITGIPIQLDGFRALYRINTSAGPGWGDVTPNGYQLPLRTYSLAGLGGVSMLGTSESGKTYLLNSGSYGTGWSLIGRSTYTGVKRSGDKVLAFGFSSLALSPDKGLTFYSRIGDWVSSVGALGEITNVAGVL